MLHHVRVYYEGDEFYGDKYRRETKVYRRTKKSTGKAMHNNKNTGIENRRFEV